jgi:hypothetical protein
MTDRHIIGLPATPHGRSRGYSIGASNASVPPPISHVALVPPQLIVVVRRVSRREVSRSTLSVRWLRRAI